MAGVLQHLRSSTLDKRPNPASMVDGQVAINYASGSPGMFFKDSNGDLVKVGPVHVGTTAPNVSPASGGTAGNSKGEQWLDTTGGTYVFKVWDGSAWRSETGTFVDVNGDTMTGALGIIAGSASTPGLFFSGDTNTGIYSPGADQLALSTNGTGRLFVDASGNVLINDSASVTSNVSAYLRIRQSNAAADTSIGIINAQNSDANATVKIKAGQFTRNGGEIVFGRENGADWTTTTAADGYIAFSPVLNNTNTERLRITSAGLVGIGTSSVSANLHVASAATASALGTIRIDGADTAGAVNAPVTLNAATQGTAGQGGSQFYIETRISGGGLTRALTVDSSQRVGIGTTSPSAMMHVQRTDTANNYVFVESVSAGNAGLQLKNNSGTYTIIANADLRFRDEVAGTDRLRIDSSGRLLVGTSSSAMSGGVVQQNGNLGIIANTATSVATNGTLDITINSGGGCFTGFMIVENTLATNAASRTQTLYAVMGRGTSATFTSLATANGSTSGASFSLSCPSNGVIRVTNTHGGATDINLCWYGPTGY